MGGKQLTSRGRNMVVPYRSRQERREYWKILFLRKLTLEEMLLFNSLRNMENSRRKWKISLSGGVICVILGLLLLPLNP